MKFTGFLFLLFIFTFISVPKAKADLGAVFPNPGDPSLGVQPTSSSSSVLAVASKSGQWAECADGDPSNDSFNCTTGLDSENVYFKIFKPTNSSNSGQIVLRDACSNPYGGDKGRALDSFGDRRIKVNVLRTINNGQYSGSYPGYIEKYNFGSGSSNGCQGNDLILGNVPDAAFSNDQDERYGSVFKTAILHVQKVGGANDSPAPGTKHYRVYTFFGLSWVTFDDLGSGPGVYQNTYPGFSAFALDDANPSGPAEATYTFKFKPDCKYDPSKPVWLKWSDADAKQPPPIANYDNDIAWKLTGGGKNITRSGAQLGGQGWNTDSRWDIGKLTEETEYTWRWSQANNNNGVQFWMPYSEGSALVTCPPKPQPEPPVVSAGCDAINFRMGSGGTLPNGQAGPNNRRYAVWVNEGGSSGDPDRNYQDNQKYSPPQIDGADYNGIAASQAGPGEGVDIDLISGHISYSGGGGANQAANRIVSGTLHYTVVIYSQYTVLSGPKAGQHWNQVWKRDTKDVGPCYRASCSVNIVENVPGNSDPNSGAVAGGFDFDAIVTIKNEGINDLPVNTGPNYLSATATSWWGPFPYFRNDHTPSGETKLIARNGGQGTMKLTFGAPNDIAARTLAFAPDYWQRFRIGPDCSAPVNTYQQYEVSFGPTTSLTPTDEDPDRVTFNSTINWVTAPSVSVNIPYSMNSTRNGAPGPFQAGSATAPAPPNLQPNFGYDPRPVSAGDEFCVSMSSSAGKGWVGPGNSILNPEARAAGPACASVHDRPYVSVYGSDVIAGSGFKDGATCNSVGPSHEISAFRSSIAGKGGSGAQFAAMAMGQISGFSSATTRTGISPVNSTRLTFANTLIAGASQGVDRPNDLGFFGDQNICSSDFYGLMGDDAIALSQNSIDLQSLQDKKETVVTPSGGVPVDITNSNPANLPKNVTLYINGNAVIKNNTAYNLGKNFKLVVMGNIYIDKSVSRLDGVYIAQPNTGVGGDIYTCANGVIPVADAALFTECHTRLLVNGAVVAKSIKLLRTISSLRYSHTGEVAPGMLGTVSTAAEIFNFSPEIYLFPFGESSHSSSSTDPYDYITTAWPTL